MSVYPENPLFKSLSASAYSLGKSLNTAPRRRGPIDLSRFKNVQQATTQATTPSNIYKKFLAAGTKTVPYGGSTKIEPGGHFGEDIAQPMGTIVPSFTGGTVEEVRRGQVQDMSKPSYGNFVTVRDQNGNLLRFSHLKNAFVRAGQTVSPGYPIGTVGNTGSTYSASGRTDYGAGSHLDLRIRDAFGKYIDPSIYLS